MTSHPRPSTQDVVDESFILLPSRPVSPSPFTRGQSFTPQSPSSSTYFLNGNMSGNNSTTTLLPQTLRPPIPRRSSSTSSTYSVSLDGQTACPTPQPELDLTDFARYAEKDPLRKFPLSITSFEKKLDHALYTIETLHKHDDVELLPLWKRRLYRLSPLITLLAVGAYFLYYAYRIHCTIIAQRAYHKVYIMAWLFIAAEGCVACKFKSSIRVLYLTHPRPHSASSTLPNAFDPWSQPSQAPSPG
jgi:hypothetical protein